MSSENVSQTLDAVSAALEHLASSLDRAGFAEGASAYQQMSEVVVGQRLWAVEQGQDEFDERFSALATLAGGIRQQLEPYVAVMSRLEALRGIVAQQQLELEPAEAKILDALAAAGSLRSLTQIATATSMPTRKVRAILERLSESGAVRIARGGGRTRYLVEPSTCTEIGK